MLVIAYGWLNSALIFNQEVTVIQPDGSKLALLASGDEFYNYLHDKNGYTIIQDEDTGYYVYARYEQGKIGSSGYAVDSINPLDIHIEPGIMISREEYAERRAIFDVPERDQSRAPTEGTLNNLVVYIRFADQSEFPEPRSDFDPLFNADDGSTPSMRSFYEEVSYGALEISSTHYPVTDMSTNLSYQDEHPRAYFSPYNAITNPEGYVGGDERAYREQTLLVNAIEFIASEVPVELDIDGDDDNRVDNVCFIIRGGNDGWAELLWAHRWSLYMFEAYINGLRVMDFTFQPRTQVDVITLNHEMFHALGSPDLYHYNASAYAPADVWDIMEGGSAHMSAYMKYRYGHWIDELPLITEPGTYSLSPLAQSENNVYRIQSVNNPYEYFVLEYRKWVPDTYEMNIPSEGLVIWRVDALLDGEGNASGPPDELYVYRPGGTNNSNGNPSGATFNADYGRTEFNDTSNPADWLQNGGYGGIFIHQVGSAEDEISFIYDPADGFIAGYVTSDNPEADLTEAEIYLGDAIVEVNTDGGFSYIYYEGFYQAQAFLPGHGIETREIEIIPGDVTMLDFDLSWLIPPTDLTFELEDNFFNMTWNFDNYEDENFSDFAIWVRLGTNINFQQIAITEDNNYQSTLSPVFDYYFYVVANYDNGKSIPTNTIEIQFTPADEEELTPLPAADLFNYPNPFNPITTISYSLTEFTGSARLEVFNIRGQLVKQFLISEPSGKIIWDGKNNSGLPVSTGIYNARIVSKNSVMTSRMIMMK